MKLRKVKNRRRPVDDTPVKPLVQVCPMEDCGHPVDEHNSFGCLVVEMRDDGEWPCACLIPREYLEVED